MKVTRRSPLGHYGMAVLCVAVAVLVRWLLHPLVGDRYIFVTFFPAVMVAAYLGGLWPGLLATLLSALAADYFYLPTANSLIPAGPDHWVGLIVAVFNMTVISVLSEALHRSRRKADDSARRVTEQENRYRTIVETAAEGVWIVDTDERTTFVNPRLVEMFGYKADEMLGHVLYDFLFEEDQEAARERLRQRRAGDNGPREFRYRRKDGTAFWATVSTSVLRGAQGEFVGLLALLTDITDRRRDQEAVERAYAQRQMILDTMYDGMLTFDHEWRYTYINRAGAEIFKRMGHDPEHLIGKAAWEAFPGLIGTPAHVEARRAMRERVATEYEFYYPPADIWFEGRAVPTPEGLTLSFRDITARVKSDEALRAALAEAQDLYNNAPCGYHSLNADGVYVSINDTELSWLGYTREEVIGKLRFIDLVPAEQLAFCHESFELFKREGQIREIEFTLRRKDGTRIPVLLTAFAIYTPAGDFLMSRTLIFDITERRQFETERNGLLRREQEARQLAENANRMKDEFLATLSHELRTPLNAIIGWTQMLRQKQLDEATAAQAVEVIYRNAKAQAQIVEDLLDVSRIITGKLTLNLQPVQLEKVVNAALDAVRPMADAKQVVISRRGAAHAAVVGDPMRLQQVVLNLLTNAVKFTPRGGRIETSIEADERTARVVVSDSGQGIRADFLPFIFERFRQADSSYTRKYTGLGLGLAIVRHLIESHGGAVEAFSAGEGQGSTFTVTLPLALAQNARAVSAASQLTSAGDAAPADTIPPLIGVKVVVVDDDEDTREVLRAILSLKGAEVSLAGSAAEAVRLVRQWRPDVLLSDIGMPDEDGYALIRAVRALAAEDGGNVRAVALTGYASDEESEHTRQAGFEAHQAKPVDAEQLIETVARLAGVGGKVRGV